MASGSRGFQPRGVGRRKPCRMRETADRFAPRLWNPRLRKKTMIQNVPGKLVEWQRLSLESCDVAAWWLGQSGFLFRSDSDCLVIDPYLSDSLATKYRDREFKHERMMPIPIQPGELQSLDFVLSTHKHTDHMDVGTLPELLDANPRCRFVAPRSARQHALETIGADEDRSVFVDAGDHITLSSTLEIDVIAAAHEELQCDDDGRSLFLGYVFHLNGLQLYHSGDCVPYDGLVETLQRVDIDVAFLPVNGRDELRAAHGIPGNFHFEEAVDLCLQAGIRNLVPQHFGMFEFNTVNPEYLERKMGALPDGFNVIFPRIDQALIIEGS